jgi:hypothetical protein
MDGKILFDSVFFLVYFTILTQINPTHCLSNYKIGQIDADCGQLANLSNIAWLGCSP